MYDGYGQNPTWDGSSFDGKEANEGTYFYKYLVQGFQGDTLEGHGFVQLER